jgi:glycosyltransferase involved in cell wall biosynthesis
MVGLKGIPAKWGGIEKYVEEVGKRLVQRGHEVTVLGSSWYCKDHEENSFEGMKIIRAPTVHLQSTDALSNALLSSVRVMFGGFDVVNFHGQASYYFLPFLRLSGRPCVVTVHTMASGWDNPKYGPFARSVIRFAFKTGVSYATRTVTVACHLQSKIKTDCGIDAEVLASGITKADYRQPRVIREKYGLGENDYLLYLGRIDPIKRVDWIVDLHKEVPPGLKIVIAGGAQDASASSYLEAAQRVCRSARNVIFAGPVLGQEKEELLSNCLAVLAPSSEEGLPITVLEAASYGKCAIASSIDAHREVLIDGRSGYLFARDSREEFAEKVKSVVSLSVEERNDVGMNARETVSERYDWDKTAARYEDIFMECTALRRSS